MRPFDFSGENSQAWSQVVLAERALPDVPAVLGEHDSVPVSFWVAARCAAVLHIRWDDHDASGMVSETNVELFWRGQAGWEQINSGGGGGGWSGHDPLARVDVPGDHLNTRGMVGGWVRDHGCTAFWGTVGSNAAYAEVRQAGRIEIAGVVAPVGRWVVCAEYGSPFTVRVFDRSGGLIGEVDEIGEDASEVTPPLPGAASAGSRLSLSTRTLRHGEAVQPMLPAAEAVKLSGYDPRYDACPLPNGARRSGDRPKPRHGKVASAMWPASKLAALRSFTSRLPNQYSPILTTAGESEMEATTVAGSADSADPDSERPPVAAVKVDSYISVLIAVVAIQVIWLAVLMSRGWFYQDDLAFLAQAHEQGMSLRYLTHAVNDHLVPGQRLVFWLLAPLGTTNYAVTIVARMLFQAAATVLLYRLLIRLVGRRPAVLGVTAAYAFSPLLLSMLWLTTAVHLLPAQILVLLGLHAFVSYVRGGWLWYAVGTGLAFAAAASFWELSAVDAVLLIPLSLGYLYTGTLRDRLRAAALQVQGWILIAAPLALYVTAFVLGGYGGSAKTPGTGNLTRSWWYSWAHTVAPMGLGGPWRWYSTHDVYFSASNPTTVAVWAVQGTAAAVVAVSVWRGGWRVLTAWSLPLIEVIIASSIVAVGRFGEFGLLSAQTINYAFNAAIPLALGITLAFPGTPARSRARPAHHATTRLLPAVAWMCAAVVLISGVVSSVRFTDRWHQNPTRTYLATLRDDIANHPFQSVFDTPLPQSVLPFIEPNRRLSDIVPLLHVPADVTSGGSAPLIADRHGHLVNATFVDAATVTLPTGNFCGDLYQGFTSRVHQLSHSPGTNEWFLRLDYFQQHPIAIYVTLIDKSGREYAPVTGQRVMLNDTLASRYLRFPSMNPVAVRIGVQSLSANVCLTAIRVGYPFAPTQ